MWAVHLAANSLIYSGSASVIAPVHRGGRMSCSQVRSGISGMSSNRLISFSGTISDFVPRRATRRSTASAHTAFNIPRISSTVARIADSHIPETYVFIPATIPTDADPGGVMKQFQRRGALPSRLHHRILQTKIRAHDLELPAWKLAEGAPKAVVYT